MKGLIRADECACCGFRPPDGFPARAPGGHFRSLPSTAGCERRGCHAPGFEENSAICCRKDGRSWWRRSGLGVRARARKLSNSLSARLGRDIDVHQCHTQRQGWAFLEIWIDEAGPLLRDFPRDLGVAIARQVGEDQLRLRLSGPADFEEVNGPGAAGSRTGLRNLCTEQGS